MAQNAIDAPAAENRALVLFERQRLDGGNGDWNELSVQLSRHWSTRQVAELGLAQTRRFGLDDTQMRLAYSQPLSQALTAAVQAQWSPTHRVLARHGLGGGLQYQLARGWLLHGGARHTRYVANDVTQASLALERYVGDFSVLAGWSPARALGETTHTVDVRAHWYYAEGSSVGIMASAGDEATPLGEGRVALAEVRSLALTGRHRLPAGPTLVWSVNRTRQGDFYTRKGAAIGFQFAF